MTHEDEWLDDLARKRAAHLAGRHDKERRHADVTATAAAAVDRHLPFLKSELVDAADDITNRVREKLRLGDTLTCVYDPAGIIRFVCSPAPGAELLITVSRTPLSMHAEMSYAGVRTNRQPPRCELRVSEGKLGVFIDDVPMPPYEAMTRLVRPFVEMIVLDGE
jgi:hypothetical protein